MVGGGEAHRRKREREWEDTVWEEWEMAEEDKGREGDNQTLQGAQLVLSPVIWGQLQLGPVNWSQMQTKWNSLWRSLMELGVVMEGMGTMEGTWGMVGEKHQPWRDTMEEIESTMEYME